MRVNKLLDMIDIPDIFLFEYFQSYGQLSSMPGRGNRCESLGGGFEVSASVLNILIFLCHFVQVPSLNIAMSMQLCI